MSQQKVIKGKAVEIISDSSFLRRIIYFWGNKQLFIFIAKTLYIYFNVPEHIYFGLRDSESKGVFFIKKISKEYNFEKYGEPNVKQK